MEEQKLYYINTEEETIYNGLVMNYWYTVGRFLNARV